MRFRGPMQDFALSIGWILAFLGLIVVLVFFLIDDPLTKEQILALFALGFAARLL